MSLFANIKERWEDKGGYKDILRIGLPLIGSNLSITIMEFTDKVLLGHYSVASVAAVGPASFAHLLFYVTFMNIIGFTGILIAQYIGAKSEEKVGKIVWQGVFIAFFCAIILFVLALFSESIFRFAKQSEELIPLERAYFDTLSYTSIIPLFNGALIAFFSGRGRTLVVTFAVVVATIINIPLNYLLIYGYGIIPELGIQGAAIATVTSWSIQLCILSLYTFTSENEKHYGIFSSFTFDIALIRRILYFGIPSGSFNFLELLGVTIFMFGIGALGQVELAATNIALSLDLFSYLPVTGLSVAVSIIVGRAMGEGNSSVVKRTLWNALHIALLWRTFFSMLFVTIPLVLFSLFVSNKTSSGAAAIFAIAPTLMLLTAIYGIADAIMLLFIGVLKGAGDTIYIMKTMFILVCITLIFPSLYLIVTETATLYNLWGLFIIYMFSALILFGLRYKSGIWKNMCVVGRG
ncbi:MAG: MATE family efflux transporter [Desulfovibrionaceae bacterium]